jgi:hypothetical protein
MAIAAISVADLEPEVGSGSGIDETGREAVSLELAVAFEARDRRVCTFERKRVGGVHRRVDV